MLFFRAATGAPLILGWLALGPGIRTVRTRRPGAHLLRGILGVGSLLLVYQALILLPLADAVTIGFSMPAFATLMSAVVLGESVGRHRWSTVAMGFLGVLIVMRPGGDHLSHAGLAYAIAAAVGGAAATVTIRELGAQETPESIVFWYFVCALVLSSIGMIFVAQPHRPLTWALLIGGGVIGAVQQVLLTKSLQLAPVAAVVPFDYTQLIWAALLGWLIWSSVPSVSTLAGAALIIASGLYTAWREHRIRMKEAVA
jgi:drug/metabolite transporter (DMT)-like permease